MIEKTSDVCYSPPGVGWKPTLAASVAVLTAGGVLVGCSDTSNAATPPAAGGEDASRTGGGGSDASSSGGTREKRCGTLIGIITLYEADYDGPGSYDKVKQVYVDALQPNYPGNDSDYKALDGDPVAIGIALDAIDDPHSKVIHRRVKDFCGPAFQRKVEVYRQAFEHGKYPYTPDWSI